MTVGTTRARASTLEENLCSQPPLTSALSVSLVVVNICVDKQNAANFDKKVIFILVNQYPEVGMGDSVIGYTTVTRSAW